MSRGKLKLVSGNDSLRIEPQTSPLRAHLKLNSDGRNVFLMAQNCSFTSFPLCAPVMVSIRWHFQRVRCWVEWHWCGILYGGGVSQYFSPIIIICHHQLLAATDFCPIWSNFTPCFFLNCLFSSTGLLSTHVYRLKNGSVYMYLDFCFSNACLCVNICFFWQYVYCVLTLWCWPYFHLSFVICFVTFIHWFIKHWRMPLFLVVYRSICLVYGARMYCFLYYFVW